MREIIVTAALCTLMGAPPVSAAQIETPTGVGGCVFLGISREMRLRVMGAYIDGGPAAIATVPNLRREVSGPGRRCSSGGDINSNDALLVAFTSTVIRSTNALKLGRAGLPQASLDAAWTEAPETARTAFLTHAQAYFEGRRPPEISQAIMDSMIGSLGLPVPPSGETRADLLNYFQGTALNVLAEARLAEEAS